MNFQKSNDTEEVSEDMRVAFLLHGSTTDEMWYNVDNIEWGTKVDEADSITKQGLKVKNKAIMLSELFRYMSWDDEKIPEAVSNRFSELTLKEYKSAIEIIQLILTSIEYSTGFSSVENNGKMDFEALTKYLTSYRKKMSLFREDPEGYLGIEK
ncbi:hypothetical protein [Reichenbachiella versicolor]|uniref:hypothetical protein n=1 Tax=Reichenbachiella versicolor TaxID=1821036 RepID=UPI0013A53966|nr:hypothetical protein [Reichenbachiella versicolor]